MQILYVFPFVIYIKNIGIQGWNDVNNVWIFTFCELPLSPRHAIIIISSELFFSGIEHVQ